MSLYLIRKHSNVTILFYFQTVGPEYTVNDTFSVIEGDSFRVDLGLTGNPLPGAPGTFQWFFNGQPLSQSGDLLLGVNSIDFGIANRAEAGTYSVSATNVAGTGTASFELIVFCEFVYLIRNEYHSIPFCFIFIQLDQSTLSMIRLLSLRETAFVLTLV